MTPRSMKHIIFLKRAAEVARGSGCIRGKRGAVIVKEGEVVVEAYNLVFPENGFCQKNGCLRDKLKLGLGESAEKCRSIHSEARAICLAVKKGISLEGAVAYITCMPCMNCAKLLVEAGIKEIYYLDLYGDRTSLLFLEKMGIKCQRLAVAGDRPEERMRDVSGQ